MEETSGQQVYVVAEPGPDGAPPTAGALGGSRFHATAGAAASARGPGQVVYEARLALGSALALAAPETFRPGRPGAWGTPSGALDPEVEARVHGLIAGVAGIDIGRVSSEAEILEGLRLDSLDALEVVMAVEEAFGIEITDPDMWSVERVGDLVALVELRRPKA